jgi:hypothetical protein
MKRDLKDLSKLKIHDVSREAFAPEQNLLAILKVHEPGYVPPGVRVRSRIDEHMFTAEFPAAVLEAIRADARVAAVELSKTLQRID